MASDKRYKIIYSYHIHNNSRSGNSTLLSGDIMPIYEYGCSIEECGHRFEVVQGIKDPVKKKCPTCEKLSLERLIFPVMGQMKEIRTLGQLAEKNTKMAGSKMQTEESDKVLRRKAKAREINEINRMSDKQKKKFIEGK